MDPIKKTKDFFLFGQGFNLRKRDSRCKSNKKRSFGIPHSTQTKGDFFHLFCRVSYILAAWPSGKAGDCKSFFPSSNPGVAWSRKNSKSLISFCWYNSLNFSPAEANKVKGLLRLACLVRNIWKFGSRKLKCSKSLPLGFKDRWMVEGLSYKDLLIPFHY